MVAEPRRPRRDASRNRQLLVESAREVFAESGIDAPLDVVAKRSGLGNATLYRHFPTREALVIETFRLDLRRHDTALAAARAEESAWGGLVGWLHFCFHDQLTDVGLTQSLARVRWGVDDDVDQLRRRTIEAIDDLIERAKRERLMRLELHLEDLVLYLQAHASLVSSGGDDAPAVSKRWLELTISALSSHPVPPTSSAADPGQEEASVIAVRDAMHHALRGTAREDVES